MYLSLFRLLSGLKLTWFGLLSVVPKMIQSCSLRVQVLSALINIYDLRPSWKKNKPVKFKVSDCPYFQLFGTLEPVKTSSPAASELLWANSRVKLNSDSSAVSSQLRSSTPASPILEFRSELKPVVTTVVGGWRFHNLIKRYLQGQCSEVS